MQEIDVHTLKVLEFPKIRDIISGLTLSPHGRRNTENLHPIFDRRAIEKSLRESAQMRDIIRFEEAMPLEQVDDLSEDIEKSRVEGIHLEPKTLLGIKSFIDIVRSLSDYGKMGERVEKFPDVVEILRQFHPKPEISKAIGKAIDSSGEILDSASSALARIRRDIGDSELKVKQHLNKILGSRTKHLGWQDDMITVRDGRYVIPYLAGEFRSGDGIVHDKSNSGATLFVEPTTAIAANNKLRQFQQDERLEIDRILRGLTAMVGEAADDILSDQVTNGKLDAVHARAIFALKIGALSPVMAEASKLNLLDARHPLLLYVAECVEDIVPLSIHLDRSSQGILVTGPNTGGKTVALKTIGLLTLMAMSGLEIPANHKSTIGIYNKIYADIGDEQSLELSLSTFSSHIRNIIAALNDADGESLVLLDEIGAGTDPKEGAALAEVILLSLLERGCNLIATTHYSQLKTLPLEHPALVNASLEFDRENLMPTFRLKIGVPGASYAIDIARRLGLADELADRASIMLGSDERSLDSLIEKLDDDLKHLRLGRRKLEERLSQAKMREQEYHELKKELEEKEREIVGKYADKFDSQLSNGKREIDRLVKEIRESQASRDKVKESHKALKNQSEQISEIKKSVAGKKKIDAQTLTKGEIVWIDKFNTEGEVVKMIGSRKVRIAIGSAFMVVDTIDVTRRGKSKKQTGLRKGRYGGVRVKTNDEPFNPEIMLRGMTVEEALEKLEKFLDDAMLAGVGQVYVIHGKGSGTLRKRMTTYLKGHRSIESIRIGDWNEGGTGVTIARLKP